MLPVSLNLTDRRVLVVGGGPVGRRKAITARGAGANVWIIDMSSRPVEFTDSNIAWISAPYQSDFLDGAVLVFAAASATVNAAVVADAHSRGIWVNSSTDPEQGDFILPASLVVGNLTVSVSTSGAAPALARRIRDRLADQFDSAYADWATLFQRIRPLILTTISDSATRRALLDRLADWPWLDRVRREGPDATFAAMLEEVRSVASRTNQANPPSGC